MALEDTSTNLQFWEWALFLKKNIDKNSKKFFKKTTDFIDWFAKMHK